MAKSTSSAGFAVARRGDTPDRRVVRSRAAILDTAAELLVERGLGGTSVDEISRRSGVAKTTIYRHWPTRADLLRDAGARLETPLATPDTGSLDGDITALMLQLAKALRSAKWPAVLPSVIDAAERDADIAAMYSELQKGFSAPFLEVLRRAETNGELSKSADHSVLVAALTGALFYRRWFSREPVTSAFVNELVRQLLPLRRRR